jgi:DNA replication protein DnaC
VKDPLGGRRYIFDYLVSLEWIVNHRNIAFVGPPGTGKSHLSVVLGRAAVEAGFRVRFLRADLLVEALYRGLADNSVGRVIDGVLRRSDLVIVDELVFSPLGGESYRLREARSRPQRAERSGTSDPPRRPALQKD